MKKPSARLLGHLALFIVVGVIMAVNAVLLLQTRGKVSREKFAMEEAAKPAELNVVTIIDSNCQACFNVQTMIASLKSAAGVSIVKDEAIDYTSDEGVELIQKYALTRVPVLLVDGDLEKAFANVPGLQNAGQRNDDGTLIVSSIPPPYVEVVSGALKGAFTLTYLSDSSCKECYDVRAHRGALAGLVMTPAEEKNLDISEEEGRVLADKYQIVSVPTILLSGDLEEYAQLAQVWPQVGTVEKDGTHVFRAGQPLMGAYKDLKTGKVVTPEPPAQVPAIPATP